MIRAIPQLRNPPEYVCLIAAALLVLAASASASAQTVEPAIAFGARHALALRTNGDVLSWGDNVGCQLGRRSGNRDGNPGLVMRNAKAIAAASDHSLALTIDGKVYGWGTNPEGALGTGNTNDQCEGPVLIESLADKVVTHIATGHGFSVVVTSTGDLLCTGDNSMGQCAAPRGSRLQSFTPVPVPDLAGLVVDVKAGAFHTLALTRHGNLFAFGRGRDGQLGNGKTVNGAGAVTELTDVVSFAAGTWHSVAARADGSVWLWGNNSKSQLCDGGTTNRAVPSKLTPIAADKTDRKFTHVAAGGHGTVMRAGDGSVFVCGDNQFGSLGVDARLVVPEPALIPVAASKAPVIAVGGANAAVSPDGCAVRLAGDNGSLLVSASDVPAAPETFTLRTNLSLCGAAAPKPLPNLLREPPRGGASGCWTPRKEEDAVANPRWAPLRQAMLAAETLLKQHPAFLDAPEPVRLRTSISAGPSDDGGGRMHIKAVAERKSDGTRVWAGECDVIPQLDRIGGAIAQISIFFNPDARGQFIGATGNGPKLTGQVGGYPEYNGWVLITKDGRLPWIPQTLEDRLNVEAERRQRALADWNRSRAGMKAPDAASLQSTYQALRKTDPAGADKFLATMKAQAEEVDRQQKFVYPATTAQLEKQIKDLERYRASFTAEQLRSPAVSGDPSGEGKRKLDAQIASLRNPTADDQRRIDEWIREGRTLDRQAQAEAAKKNTAEAAQLRAQANELGLKARALRQSHMENAAPLIADAAAQYDLASLQPGPADRALSFKPDPTFPDFSTPNRIQVIAISFSQDPDKGQTARIAWQQRTKATFDFAALAAMIK